MDERIGHYRIVEELGRGGMGVVYKAHEESLNRPVALKVLGEHLAAEEGFVARFVREAQSAAKLQHPNIVQIYFIGEDRGRHFFAMEMVKGRSLRDVIADQGRLPIPQAVEIVSQAAAGLAAAHDQGVVHRDIKPANLMVTDEGMVKITDFGLALFLGGDATKLTATGALMGTPAYISPEQCEGLKPDQRSDIYSLGITLYEMLSGDMPFHSDSPMGLLRQILQSEPPPVGQRNPEVDPGLAQVLSRMMNKDREQRYANCHQVVRDLAPYRRAGAAEPAATAPVAVRPPPPPSGRAPEVAVLTPAGQEATLKLAESTALAPRGETALAAPVGGSRKRLLLVLVALAALLLLAGSAATLLLWTISRPDPTAENGSKPAVASLDPKPASAGLDPKPASAGLDPKPASAGLDPKPASAGLDPKPASAGLDPKPASAGLDPKPASAGLDPKPASAGLGPKPASAVTDPMAPAGGAELPATSAATGAPLPASATRPTPGTGVLTTPAEPRPPTNRSRPPAAEAGLEPPSERGGLRPASEQGGLRPPPEQGGLQPPGLAAPPPLPARPTVCVIGIGEPVLAVASELLLEEELPRRGLALVDENRWPRIGDLLHARSGLSVEGLVRDLDAAGVHVLILAEADYVSERPLRYLDRTDRAVTSRLRLNALLTAEGAGLGSGWGEELEYTPLTARRQAEAALLPVLREVVASVEAGWDDYRSQR